MSELSSRLNKVDEEHQNIILKALEKEREGNKKGPAMIIPPDDEDSKANLWDKGGSPIVLFGLCLLNLLTIVAVIVFASRAAYTVNSLKHSEEEIQVLMEEREGDYEELQRYVKAVEFEFRRAFKKDREDMKAIQDVLLQKHGDLDEKMQQFSEGLRADVMVYKTSVTDNESKMSRIDRQYENLMVRFNEIQSDLRILRGKVMTLTAPDLPALPNNEE